MKMLTLTEEHPPFLYQAASSILTAISLWIGTMNLFRRHLIRGK